MNNAYEKWQAEQKEKDEQHVREHAKEIDDEQQNNIYSTTAKSFSDMLKNLSRTVVFQVLSAFEKIIGSS